MTKKVLGLGVLSTLVVAGSLFIAAPSFAAGYGPGGNGGAGGSGMGTPMSINAEELGIFEDVVDQALADFLGISFAEFQASHEGEPGIAALAEQYGVSVDDLMAVMQEARAEAVAEAVAEGLITVEQGEFLLERVGGYGGVGMNAQSGATVPGSGAGASINGVGRGFRQGGQGQLGGGMMGAGAMGASLAGDSLVTP